MFWDKYFALCSKTGKSPNAVAKEIGISSGTLTGWKKHNKVPLDMTIKKVSDYFGVPVSYFSEDGQEKEKSPVPNSETEDILKIYEMLTPERQKQLRTAIADLLKEQLQG